MINVTIVTMINMTMINMTMTNLGAPAAISASAPGGGRH